MSLKHSRSGQRLEEIASQVREFVVIGGQFGDEGKGKVVDRLAQQSDIIVRYQGGANAGHTVVVKDHETGEEKETILHLLPSGILHADKKVALGPEVVVDLTSMYEDEVTPLIDDEVSFAHLYMSPDINLVTNVDKFLDHRANRIYHIGTTARGIGPAYGNAASRARVTLDDALNLSAHELAAKISKQAAYAGAEEFDVISVLHQFGKEIMEKAKYDEQRTHALRLINTPSFSREAEEIKRNLDAILNTGKVDIAETRHLLREADHLGQTVLKEGAQGVLLDITHGYVPFVTSSDVANADNNIGYAPLYPRNKIGVFKAYMTKVGNGPFPTKLEEETGEWLREKGNEYGATTKRPRDTGWFDVPLAKYAIEVAGINQIALTKLDVLTGLPEIKIAVGREGMDKKELFERTPEYETMPGWTEDISGITSFEELPANAQAYVNRISELTGVEVAYIGTGKDRDSLIIREAA